MLLPLLVLITAHSAVSNQQQDNEPERFVADFLNSQDGGLDGHTIKQVAGIGDRAAVAITKTIGARGFRPTDPGRVLDILEIAFLRGTVANEADRTPATALFVLSALERMPQSQKNYKDVEDLKSQLENQLKAPK